MPPPPSPSLSPPLARGGLADSPSSPRPPSMRRAGARAEMRQRPPFVLHTSELAGGGRPRRAFPGKMELRWVAWYVVRTVGGGGGGRCTEEARDTRHARDGGGGRGGGQKAREQTPCSLSHSLPTVCTPRHSVGSSLHRTRTLRSHMQKGECDQRTNVWLGSKFYAHKE